MLASWIPFFLHALLFGSLATVQGARIKAKMHQKAVGDLITLTEHSSFALTVKNNNIADYEQIILHGHGGTAQSNNKWTIQGNGLITLRDHPWTALTVKNNNIADYEQIILHEHRDTPQSNNKWTVQANGLIVLTDHPYFALTVRNNNIANYEQIILHRHGVNAQSNNNWKTPPASDDPVLVNGAWVPLRFIVGTMTLTEKHGTHKTSSSTMTQSWAEQVAATVSTSMTAGVGFAGFGAEVTGSVSVKASIRNQMINSFANEWGETSEQSFEVEFSQGDEQQYLWQWVLKIKTANGNVLTTKTQSFALTDGRWMTPKCVPGYASDAPRYQRCIDKDSRLR